MNTSVILARARALHGDVMVDSCTITRPTRSTLDETSGRYAAGMLTVYTGSCRVKEAPAGTKDAAGIATVTSRPVLELPYAGSGAVEVRVGDVVAMSSGPFTGQSLRVVTREFASTSACHRFTVEVRQ